MSGKDVFRKILKDFSTERDGSSYDFFRLTAILGAVAFVVYTGYDVFCLKHWSPIEYGTGLSAVLVATASAVRVNEGAPAPTPPTVDAVEVKP